MTVRRSARLLARGATNARSEEADALMQRPTRRHASDYLRLKAGANRGGLQGAAPYDPAVSAR